MKYKFRKDISGGITNNKETIIKILDVIDDGEILKASQIGQRLETKHQLNPGTLDLPSLRMFIYYVMKFKYLRLHHGTRGVRMWGKIQEA